MRLLTLILFCAAAAMPQQPLNIIWEGSSSTWGTAIRPAAEANLTADGYTFNSRNQAVAGEVVGAFSACPGATTTIACEAATEVDPYLNEYAGVQVLWLQNDTNGLWGGTAGSESWSRVVDYLSRRDASWVKIGMTMTPRNAGLPDHATAEASRQTYNGSARSTCADSVSVLTNGSGGVALKCGPGSPYNYVIDAAADTRLGDDGDQADTTYYSGDGIHLNATGGAIVADLITAAMEDAATATPAPSGARGSFSMTGGRMR